MACIPGANTQARTVNRVVTNESVRHVHPSLFGQTCGLYKRRSCEVTLPVNVKPLALQALLQKRRESRFPFATTIYLQFNP